MTITTKNKKIRYGASYTILKGYFHICLLASSHLNGKYFLWNIFLNAFPIPRLNFGAILSFLYAVLR